MLNSSSNDLRELLSACAYPGYVYGYPHKKAYRPLERPVPLADAWRDEDRRNLYCYVHVPFCNQRCSFCNLFTYVPGGESPVTAYLDAMAREMAAYAAALGDARFARLYLGGGTPTYLDVSELHQLMRHLREILGVEPAQSDGCIEASPETLDAAKVDALREMGFVRISLGVQSFVAEELAHVNRRFDYSLHDKVIALIGAAGFPHFNVDLIYGLPGQTPESWRHSLQRAIDSPATSLFLYPLYVRPMTGLAVKQHSPTTHQMAAMYDDAVARLQSAGFRQLTMRQFRRDDDRRDGEYSCQRDGMVGLGAGARSYTQRLHYSTPWRMVARNIRAVVEDYAGRMRGNDTDVSFGIALDADERRRRHVVQSLLYDGVEAHCLDAFPDVRDALFAEGCVERAGDVARLTPRGTRHADVVGQMFFSDRVRRLTDEYEYDE